MPLRIITDNAADRATITATNTVAGMGVDKLKSDIRGDVCRILGTTTQIVLTWASLEFLSAAVIPACSLGPNSTIRCRTYLDAEGNTLLADSGTKYAAPGAILENWDFSLPLNVNVFPNTTTPVNANLFSNGLSFIVASYLPVQTAGLRMVIDIVDPDATFIDLSRLVVGGYIEPQYNPEYGQEDTIVDLSVNARTAGGDLKTDWGPKAKKKTFNLDWIKDADRAKVHRILEAGIGNWIFVSIIPEDYDPVREREKSIYGKLSQPVGLNWSRVGLHSASFDIEGF